MWKNEQVFKQKYHENILTYQNFPSYQNILTFEISYFIIWILLKPLQNFKDVTRAEIWARVRAARSSHSSRALAHDHIVTKFTNWKIFQTKSKFKWIL